MKNKLLILALAAATMLAGCKKEDGDGGTFAPPTQEQLTQNAYADHESTGGGFSFTTDAPWTATVNEVQAQVAGPVSVQAKSVTRVADDSGNNVVWLRLYNGDAEAYSGGAGTITLRIEMDQNYTGERREATITIRSGNNTFTVTVVQEGTRQDGSQNDAPVPVEAIALDTTALALAAGETATLTATVTPADATIRSVVWSSSDPSVAEVNPVTGLITAVADGEAVVTATSSSNKEVSASCSVRVGNSEPVVPAEARRVSEVYSYFEDSQYDEDSRIELTYDEQNRLVHWKRTRHKASAAPGVPETVTETYAYEYSDGVVRIRTEYSDRFGAEHYDITAYLNAAGYAERIEETGPEETEPYVITYEYDAENHLVRAEQDGEWNECVWKDGNMVEFRLGDLSSEEETRWIYTYTALENRESPDAFVAMLGAADFNYEELQWADLLGVRNRNLVESIRGNNEWSYKDAFDLEYEVDGEGFVAKAVEYGLTPEGGRVNPRVHEVGHTASRE